MSRLHGNTPEDFAQQNAVSTMTDATEFTLDELIELVAAYHISNDEQCDAILARLVSLRDAEKELPVPHKMQHSVIHSRVSPDFPEIVYCYSAHDYDALRAIAVADRARVKELESMAHEWHMCVMTAATIAGIDGLDTPRTFLTQLRDKIAAGDSAESRVKDANSGHLAATDPDYYEGSLLQELDNVVHELIGDEGDDDSLTVLRRYKAEREAMMEKLRDQVPCRHEWYQGACVHCHITPEEFKAMTAAMGVDR